MKTQKSIMLVATLLAASQLHAEEPAAPQTLTFPPQTMAGGNQVQYPGVAQPGPQFPSQATMQQAPAAYPYYNYQNYANPGYTQGYYPYAQQQQVYRQNYYPYAQQRMPQQVPQQAYNPYQTYNPYMAQQQPGMMPGPARQPVQKKKVTKPWGDIRYIWPDFYTDFTGDAWDKMINAPYDMGRMPGGWQFPSISTPDPVTVSDAIANQVPPFAEEAGNMVPLDDVGNMRPF